jgi:hypothetical protein
VGLKLLSHRFSGEQIKLELTSWRDLCEVFLASALEQIEAIPAPRRQSFTSIEDKNPPTPAMSPTNGEFASIPKPKPRSQTPFRLAFFASIVRLFLYFIPQSEKLLSVALKHRPSGMSTASGT